MKTSPLPFAHRPFCICGWCEAEAARIARRLRAETTFCHHGKNMVEQCTACEDEEDNR